MQSISQTYAELRVPRAAGLRSRFASAHFVLCTRVLPADMTLRWRETARLIIKYHSRRIRHEATEHVLRYRVVTGEVVRQEWPELFALYESAELRAWVAEVTGVSQVFTSSHLQSAVNINAMGKPGEVYRWHTDAEGFTLLLYLSDSSPADGGALQLRPPGVREPLSIVPKAGSAVLLDGARCLHRVAPILLPHERISIPLVFTPTQKSRRPAGLDDYLYSSR